MIENKGLIEQCIRFDQQDRCGVIRRFWQVVASGNKSDGDIVLTRITCRIAVHTKQGNEIDPKRSLFRCFSDAGILERFSFVDKSSQIGRASCREREKLSEGDR